MKYAPRLSIKVKSGETRSVSSPYPRYSIDPEEHKIIPIMPDELDEEY